jgi:hypothetical protein
MALFLALVCGIAIGVFAVLWLIAFSYVNAVKRLLSPKGE